MHSVKLMVLAFFVEFQLWHEALSLIMRNKIFCSSLQPSAIQLLFIAKETVETPYYSASFPIETKTIHTCIYIAKPN